MTRKGKTTHLGNGEEDSQVSPLGISSIFLLKKTIIGITIIIHKICFYTYFRHKMVKSYQKHHLHNVHNETENEF
ncbi:hypothetical protein RHMOL_Rhmol04G0047000 [Rhododendron molle]|uniref:Uncharacterized protein n=1 Tax=Rhododendron molle TaxID=49168 RepID=A0ACC0NZI4_RHOML|nr:hypothetical protein RHMOL_Rhmol04G0047000 [Rhododendron molle]